MMSIIEIFDPAMCCSTGVCGPDVDPLLPRFAADLEWIGQQGVTVTRHNMAKDPGTFAENEAVMQLLQEHGNACLPIILVNGEVRNTSAYPSREMLSDMVPGLSGNGQVAEQSVSSCCCGTSCC